MTPLASALLPVLATAYCTPGRTATGRRAAYGVVAVDPRVVPLHSRVVIRGRTFYAEDTGPYVKGRRVDVFMASCADAKDYVRRYRVRVYRR